MDNLFFNMEKCFCRTHFLAFSNLFVIMIGEEKKGVSICRRPFIQYLKR